MDYNKVPFLFLSETKITVNPLYNEILKSFWMTFDFAFGLTIPKSQDSSSCIWILPRLLCKQSYSYLWDFDIIQTDRHRWCSFAILNKVSEVKFIMSPKDCVLLMDVTMYWPWGSGPWWTIKLHQNIIRVTQAAHLHIQLSLTLSTMGMSEL